MLKMKRRKSKKQYEHNHLWVSENSVIVYTPYSWAHIYNVIICLYQEAVVLRE